MQQNTHCPVSLPANLKEIATKGFMVVSCAVQCGEQHTKSATILSHAKSSQMTSKMAASSKTSKIWLPNCKFFKPDFGKKCFLC